MPAIKTTENVVLGQIMLHLPSWGFLFLPLQCLFQITAKDKHCNIHRFRVVMSLLHQKFPGSTKPLTQRTLRRSCILPRIKVQVFCPCFPGSLPKPLRSSPSVLCKISHKQYVPWQSVPVWKGAAQRHRTKLNSTFFKLKLKDKP